MIIPLQLWLYTMVCRRSPGLIVHRRSKVSGHFTPKTLISHAGAKWPEKHPHRRHSVFSTLKWIREMKQIQTSQTPRRKTSVLALIACALATTGEAQDDVSSGWNWGAEVYFWGASIGGTASNGEDIDIGIDDLLDNFKLGFMGTVTASRDNWILFFDAIYLDVGDDGATTGNIGNLPVPISASIDMKAFISTFGAGYKIYETAGTTLHATGGLRYLWLDTDIDATVGVLPPLNISASDGNWDAVVGLQGQTDLSDKWYVSYYADIGTGESDFTWQAKVGLNYRLKKADLTFGYRYLDWDLENKGAFDDLNLSGAFVGVKFSF